MTEPLGTVGTPGDITPCPRVGRCWTSSKSLSGHGTAEFLVKSRKCPRCPECPHCPCRHRRPFASPPPTHLQVAVNEGIKSRMPGTAGSEFVPNCPPNPVPITARHGNLPPIPAGLGSRRSPSPASPAPASNALLSPGHSHHMPARRPLPKPSAGQHRERVSRSLTGSARLQVQQKPALCLPAAAVARYA